jgi:antitoxin (DNA-binding transcriptional repressor) of toxin-antitoxin stability system
MIISIAEFKARCSDIIRDLERGGEVVDFVRDGEIVARLLPATPAVCTETKPWERLRGTGVLLATPEESVLEDRDFEALRAARDQPAMGTS